MTVEKLLSGGYRLSCMVNGYLFSVRYFDYTLNEAKRMFKAEVKAEKNRGK